ncbi:sulfonate ABC transporter substrate-binding protein [Leptolyngbya sp. FACHB-261]|uniref:sulfonate ABC transporter substrate-binding protein n=1 Tax=Leptolyngbya sp. FACHB-261 TaxID=2692806 RepID=UPI0028C3C210|nr:sulfonate ABC transporter substrate-binding protein [Leptolyngbya sp. FACHB-261]
MFSLLFAVGLGLSLAISACTPSNSASSSSAPAATPAKSVVRVGYQKYGTVNILKAQGGLEKRLESLGVSVEWTEFPGGPQLLEALNVGSIDFGHTGEAPPIFAQAAGAPLVYVANEPASPASEAILVAKDSPIKSVADLKGKKVALNKGSNVHYLLVQALAAAGLKYNEIQPVYLPPSDGRVAFQQGKVDAWVIWDPFFGAAQKATEARILADGKDLVANREFYLAERKFADQHADLIQALIEEIQKIDAWAADKPTEVAKLLSPQLGIEVPVLEQVARRRNYGAQLIQPDVVAYQQKVADTFFELGLIPKKLTVQEAVWTPKA